MRSATGRLDAAHARQSSSLAREEWNGPAHARREERGNSSIGLPCFRSSRSRGAHQPTVERTGPSKSLFEPRGRWASKCRGGPPYDAIDGRRRPPCPIPIGPARARIMHDRHMRGLSRRWTGSPDAVTFRYTRQTGAPVAHRFLGPARQGCAGFRSACSDQRGYCKHKPTTVRAVTCSALKKEVNNTSFFFSSSPLPSMHIRRIVEFTHTRNTTNHTKYKLTTRDMNVQLLVLGACISVRRQSTVLFLTLENCSPFLSK